MESCAPGTIENCDPATDQASYKVEDYEEYLLIQEAAPASSGALHSQTEEAGLKQKCGKEKLVKTSSTDSGYEGKVSSNPATILHQNNTTEQDLYDDWCIVEQDTDRPKGLYGYRYVNYDDQEAEGNIHITDQDL